MEKEENDAAARKDAQYSFDRLWTYLGALRERFAGTKSVVLVQISRRAIVDRRYKPARPPARSLTRAIDTRSGSSGRRFQPAVQALLRRQRQEFLVARPDVAAAAPRRETTLEATARKADTTGGNKSLRTNKHASPK